MLLRPATTTGLAAVAPLAPLGTRLRLAVPRPWRVALAREARDGALARAGTRAAASRLCGALSCALAVRSGLGTGPWDTLAAALHALGGVGVGAVNAALSAGFAALAWRLGARINPWLLGGHALAGALAVDWLLPRVPAAASPGAACAYLAGALAAGVAGAVVVFGTPEARTAYDHALLAVAARGGWGSRRARWALDVPALTAGWALGGATGPGTVACALLVGPLAQRLARGRGAGRSAA